MVYYSFYNLIERYDSVIAYEFGTTIRVRQLRIFHQSQVVFWTMWQVGNSASKKKKKIQKWLMSTENYFKKCLRFDERYFFIHTLKLMECINYFVIFCHWLRQLAQSYFSVDIWKMRYSFHMTKRYLQLVSTKFLILGHSHSFHLIFFFFLRPLKGSRLMRMQLTMITEH